MPSQPSIILSLALTAACIVSQPACAEPASGLSEASMLPVAVSVAVPVMLVAGIGSLVVTGVEASANGVAWIVEGSVDGAKGSIRFAGQAVGASAIAVGTVVTVTAVGTGLILSNAGQVIAFIPNELGKTLFHNQKVSP